jgi:hypothetical protein
VFEASVLLAEWGKPETVERPRTRGSHGPDDSLGHGQHMEQERGACKVEFEIEPVTRKSRPANATKLCRKIRQAINFAHETITLPLKHTFFQIKY